MLKKKEILAIPPLALPKSKDKATFATAVAVVSGLLIVDMENKSVRMRYACDGVNSIQAVWEDDEGPEWSGCKPTSALGYTYWRRPTVSCDTKGLALAYSFMKEHDVSSWRLSTNDLFATLDGFCEAKNGEQRQKRWDAENDLFRRLTALFPAYPTDLHQWCEEKRLFGDEYLFIGKLEKGKRTAICSACGKRYTVSGVKHRDRTTCRRCKREVTTIGEWYDLQLTARTEVTMCHKTGENELLIRTSKIERRFVKGQKRYETWDTSYVIYSKNRYGEPTIYSYALRPMPYHGAGWSRMKNNKPWKACAWIYTRNLHEVFGEKIYNVDLRLLDRVNRPITLITVLDELKNNPVAEYLFKQGMFALLESGQICDVNEARNFGELLGVNPQYKAMYRELDISYSEHAAIKWAKGYVHTEDMRRLREWMGDAWPHQRMIDLLAADTFDRIVRYLAKQIPIQKEDRPKDNEIGRHVVVWLTDYWNMCRSLSIPLDNKGVRYPRDIKEAHDRLNARIAVARAEQKKKEDAARARKERRSMQAVIRNVYPRIVLPKSEKYTAVFPLAEEDFIREGTALSHCVGNGAYYRTHIEGNRLIVFIRKLAAPEKPLYTAQIDIARGVVIQIYGYDDTAAPEDAKAFAKKLAKNVLPSVAAS